MLILAELLDYPESGCSNQSCVSYSLCGLKETSFPVLSSGHRSLWDLGKHRIQTGSPNSWARCLLLYTSDSYTRTLYQFLVWTKSTHTYLQDGKCQEGWEIPALNFLKPAASMLDTNILPLALEQHFIERKSFMAKSCLSCPLFWGFFPSCGWQRWIGGESHSIFFNY